jgi:hypothetical protein
VRIVSDNGSADPDGVAELYTGAPLVEALFGLLPAIPLAPGRTPGMSASTA